MSDSPYSAADDAISLLNKKAIRRFNTAYRNAGVKNFDELNVMKVIKKLYEDLASDNKKTFLELAQIVYRDAGPNGSRKPTEKWLKDLLEEDDPVALYVYLNEITRKRDYAIEAIVAAPNKKREFDRALRYWARMTAHEADRITDKAVLKAYKDAGVKKVRWKTEEDDKVCSHCEPRDGKVYDIDKVPPKPHVGCRCYLIPVKGDGD